MMKNRSKRLASLLLLGLGLGIAAIWVLGSSRWQPPLAQTPDASLFQPPASPPAPLTTVNFPQQLERPVFVHGRKPVVPDAPAPVAAVNPFAEAAVLGIFNDGRHAGVLLRMADGKVRRLRRGEAVDGWKLEQVSDNVARFSSTSGAQAELAVKRRVASELPPIQSRAGVLSGTR